MRKGSKKGKRIHEEPVMAFPPRRSVGLWELTGGRPPGHRIGAARLRQTGFMVSVLQPDVRFANFRFAGCKINKVPKRRQDARSETAKLQILSSVVACSNRMKIHGDGSWECFKSIQCGLVPNTHTHTHTPVPVLRRARGDRRRE